MNSAMYVYGFTIEPIGASGIQVVMHFLSIVVHFVCVKSLIIKLYCLMW